IAVADFDGDGHEDVFLSQNSFALDREAGRLDAGCGLWLRGDGTGGFLTVPASESGLSVYGEQRGAAAADFDNDGRTDLVVAQHAAPLKLFRNRGARVGLRVRLVGPPGNLNGIGAQVRLRFGERYGAMREIQAGSGYWSQNSSIVILAKPAEPSHLWVRWPGSKVTETILPSGATEVSVDPQGQLRVMR
ncbi:MAG: CRTAC1 family protein, partial [Verrucomicrobia bacterium]|nr:CRTAC1 family protein [Verrucomicrobiota bacterium]